MRSRQFILRRGFTLVELLVAAGVSLVLMLIITEAFKRGIDMFRAMRATGNMQERLRLASTVLRDDLASYHFPQVSNAGSLQYVSVLTQDPNLYPPADGFFRIYQGPT